MHKLAESRSGDPEDGGTVTGSIGTRLVRGLPAADSSVCGRRISFFVNGSRSRLNGNEYWIRLLLSRLSATYPTRPTIPIYEAHQAAACMYEYLILYTHTYIYASMCIHVYVDIYIYVGMYVCTYMHTYMRT